MHHGGGVGIGNSIHAGMVIVADGTAEMDERLERTLTNDPGLGVARHADAGYAEAIAAAEQHGIRLPMREHAVSGARTAVLTGVTGGWGRAVLDLFCERGWNVAATHRGRGRRAARRRAGGRGRPDRSGLRRGRWWPRPSSGSARSTRWPTSPAGFAPAGLVEEAPLDVYRAADGDQLRHRPEHDPGRAPRDEARRSRLDRLRRLAAATHPFSGGAAYALSKIAVRGLMQVVDVENRTAGIRANELVLKIVDTPRNREENPMPTSRGGQPATSWPRAIEWLCSDASAPLSGGTIPAYGRA